MPNLRPETTYSACDYRSDELAKEMLANIIGEKSFDIDDIEWDDSKITVPDDLMSDWKTKVDPVTIDELTERKVKGSGVFDAMMHAIRVHLKEEYDNNRITGAEYATTYTRLTEAALANAVQFCLQKNQAYFQGILAQAQAITAGIQAQIAALTAKVQLAKVKAEALGVAAQYALTTMKLSTEDAQHALVCKQEDLAKEQAKLAEYQARYANPDATDNKNLDFLIKQKQLAAQEQQAKLVEYQAIANNPKPTGSDIGKNVDYLLKEKQTAQIQKNIDHIGNQMLVEDAQKDLYVQQKTSFIRKSERDVADLFSNAYLAMKSVDEGLAIPKALSGASINEVLQNLKTNVDLGSDSTNIGTYTIPGHTSYEGRSYPDVATADKAYLQNGVLKADANDNKENEEEETPSNP